MIVLRGKKFILKGLIGICESMKGHKVSKKILKLKILKIVAFIIVIHIEILK